MKRPSEAERINVHRDQALRYWRELGTPETPAPRYVVLCAFHRFEVWEPGAVYTAPRVEFDLPELPDHVDSLLFLAGREPFFAAPQAQVTREAVALVTDLYMRLRERSAADLETLRGFLLQVVWALFAEDVQMLPSHLLSRLLDGLLEDSERSSADDLGQLFRYLSEPEPRPRQGKYAGTPYANGGLFKEPHAVHLEPEELRLLRKACDFDWKRGEPAIFGSLLQGALGRERQWSLGAHYTAEADILKVVLPTIVEPWRRQIDECRTLADVEAAQLDLSNYVVLDPACGSGNFLYVAYRELRRIEAALRRRAEDMRRSAGLRRQESMALHFPIENIKGIELDRFAVDLARLSLWMGHKLSVDELDLAERVLPLPDLSGIRRQDALRIQWPEADAIIGNPPYHGSQQIRGELGDDYAEWLRSEFGIGLKDYAVYWFRKAHERLADGGRAGYVATNSITQNRNRGPTLEWIAETGGVITSAISTQDWTGEAAVDVSIVNWVKNPIEPPSAALLDGREVEGITPALRPAGLDVSQAARLPANRGLAFQGPKPVGAGFVLDSEEAETLLARSEADYRAVVRPYLIGKDIAEDPAQAPRRFVIDFAQRTLEQATAWPAALQILRDRVKHDRESNRDRYTREHWWRHGRPVLSMREAVAPLRRYIAGNRIGKRILFCWADPWTCPSDLTTVVAFEHDYAMGILSSRVHQRWARAQSSTLEDRMRYTPTSAFETFPWPPDPSPDQREEVGRIAAAVVERRQEICAEREIGLTQLLNEVDEGAYADLRALLDASIAPLPRPTGGPPQWPRTPNRAT
ncbi:MAG: class I SAM-dependent DNA methyltransferase, partial [Actinobacteria bacterium]|nr:class I SAM-dependent DNA methyltransferase [Actinomycetota bacterium]